MGGWLALGLALIVVGLGTVVVAGTIAVTRHPDRNDNERNARRYVRPAMFGALLVIVGLVLSLLAGIGLLYEAIT